MSSGKKLLECFFVRHPESELVRKTFTLRKMDLPPQVLLTKKSLLRWMALSVGLISENESRSTVIDILDVTFAEIFAGKKPSSKEIRELLVEKRGVSVSEKLVRYHLNRLCELGFLMHEKGFFRINPAPEAERDDLKEAFSYWFKKELSETVPPIEKAFQKLQEAYKK